MKKLHFHQGPRPRRTRGQQGHRRDECTNKDSSLVGYAIPLLCVLGSARVRVTSLRPPVFRMFADSGCSRSVILSYHYSTTNLHEFTILSNLT
jgi:hypothetical protein